MHKPYIPMTDAEKEKIGPFWPITEHARKTGCTIQHAFDMYIDKVNEKAFEQKWGTSPSNYDPANDDTHPDRGWKP